SQRLRIGRSNFRLPSDIQSKEATLQVIYDVLRNSPLFRAFQVTADVPEIYMQEFWATAKLHHHSIRFNIDTKKSVLVLEAFREMLHISPRIPNQPFADLPTEEEVLDFLRFLGHSQDIRYLTDVVSRHQATQQYGAILPIELTSAEIRNSKSYQEYYACVMGEAMPKPKASTRKKKGDSASSTTPPTPTPTTTTEQKTHISQQSGSGTGERTSSKPGVPDVPSDDSEEELLWKSSDDEEVGSHEEGKESNDDSDDGSDKDSDETFKSRTGKDGDGDDDEDDDDDDEEEETAKNDEENKETGKGGDEVRKSRGESKEEKETSEEEEGSFDLIPRTPKDSENESDDEEEQESRLSEEARIKEEEDVEELYHDVNINQGRGLQVTQSVEDTHVILTPVNPDDPQESSSMSSFVSSMLNPLSDVGVEFVFTTTSSQIVSLEPPTPIMPPSTIATITTSESVNATLEAKVLTRSSHSSRTSYTVAADLSEMSASESAYAEEPVQTTRQMEETLLSVYETGADDQPIVQTSQHPEWFSQPRKPPSPDRAWNTALPAAQGDAQSWISDLPRKADARSSFNELLDTSIDFSNFIMHRLNFYGYAVNQESARDVYSKRRII
nr:hypothetical protein [Tanacetum cinerariifolium]